MKKNNETISELIKLNRKGLTLNDISGILKVNRRTLQAWGKEYDIVFSNKTNKKTHDEFINEINRFNQDYIVIGNYVNRKTKIKCRCNKCLMEWDVEPGTLLKGSGCPKCNRHNSQFKKYDDNTIQIIMDLSRQGVHQNDIAKEIGVHLRTIKRWAKKYKIVLNTYENVGYYVSTEEYEVQERIKKRYPKFEYIGNYTGIEGTIDLKCNDCGYKFTRNSQLVKPSYNKNVICPKCEEIEIEKRKIEREILKQKKKQEKEKARIERLEKLEAEKLANIKTVKCDECGRKFETSKSKIKCCSKECSKKRQNRNKDKRIYKNGKPDFSITLTKLIKRDKNICHICGEKCNDEDFYYKDTFFIAGEDYPSIDHIVPIAKGGEHKWENIKLAHRRCNNKKRDSLIYTAKDNQLMFTI